MLVGKKWLVVDADSFKLGYYPKNEHGKWASLKELRKKPFLLDQIPSLGLQLSKNAIWAKNHFEKEIKGYHDFGLSWENITCLIYIFGENEKLPLECKDLIITTTKNILSLNLHLR